MRQRGYVDIDVGGAMIVLLVVGVVVGIAIDKVLMWLWPYIKSALLWSLT